jgi:ribosome biogenesis GTPase A
MNLGNSYHSWDKCSGYQYGFDSDNPRLQKSYEEKELDDKRKKEKIDMDLYKKTGWTLAKYGYLWNPLYSIINDVYVKKFADGYALGVKNDQNGVSILISGQKQLKSAYRKGKEEVSYDLYKTKHNLW